ncbi:MAG: transglutaminase domain-containing protein [Candidatus Hodarchaeaceae archaeon]|nr:transglutaminase domain-containing protein [Candidatus Hodarchaeaceae archaeon]
MRKVALLAAVAIVAAAMLSIAVLQRRPSDEALREFAGSMGEVRGDLKYGRELGKRYSIAVGGLEYSLTPPQLLYCSADAIVAAARGERFSIERPISVAGAGEESGDFTASWRSLSKDDYLGLALGIRDEVEATGRAPGSVEASIGRIRFRDILFTFSRILLSYREGGRLPDEIKFAPAPSGNLALDNFEIPASYAYFLLPSTQVITGSERVNEVLSQVRGLAKDDRELARKLCEWTSTHITYVFLVGLTSEQVLELGKGQCGDFTNVYLALARTAGIPARRVAGRIVFTGEFRPPPGFEMVVGTTPEGENIVSHAWVEVYLPGEGWAPVESQGRFGQLPYRVYTEMEEEWRDALAAYETKYGNL